MYATKDDVQARASRESSTLESPARDRKHALRGMTFDEGARSLTPEGAPLQMKASGAAPVQMDASDEDGARQTILPAAPTTPHETILPPAPDDDIYGDGDRDAMNPSDDAEDRPAIPPPEADPRTQVVCAINERRNKAKDDLQVIIGEREPLEQKIADAKAKADPSDEDKAELARLEARKKELGDEAGKLNTTIQKASAELDLVENPATPNWQIKTLGAKYGTAKDSGKETEQTSTDDKDEAAAGHKKGVSADNGYVDVHLPGGGSGTKTRSDTVSEVKNGAAITETNTSTKSLTKNTESTEKTLTAGDLSTKQTTSKETGLVDGGLGRKTSESESVSYGDHDGYTKESSKSTTIGKDGLTSKTTNASSQTTNGKTTSTSSSNATSIGPGGITNTKTGSTTDADGNKTEDTSTIKVGKDGVAASSSNTVTDANGNATTKASNVSADVGRVDDDNGKGVKAKVGVGEDRTKVSVPKDTAKTGVGTTTTTSYGGKAACDGKVQLLVQRIPKSDPPKVRVVVTINFGVSLGANASGSKSNGGGAKAGVNGSVSASGNVMAQFGQEMDESQVEGYLASVDSAGRGIGGRAEQLIGIGNTQGWEAAARMYNGLGASLEDPTEAGNMPEGASMELDVSGEAGGELGAEVGGGGFSVGVSGGKSVAGTVKFGVVKKNGMMVVTAGVSSSETTKGGGSVKAGVAGMSVGHSSTSGSGISYVFTLDPASGSYGADFAALRACKTQEALKEFAATHGALVGEHTETTSSEEKDTQGFTLGGDALAANFGQGAGRSSTSRYDKDGNLIGQENEGHNSQGGSVSAAGFTYSDTNTEQAKAMKIDGESAVDVNQVDEESNLGNQIINKVDSKTGGSGKELDEETKHVAGMILTKGDLDRLVALANSDDVGAWANHTGDGDIRDGWVQVREQVRAAGGDTDKVANILADFVGTKGSGRDDVIYHTVRGVGSGAGGHRYELPESIQGEKEEFVALTVANPLKEANAFLAELDAAKGDADKLAALEGRKASLAKEVDDVVSRCSSLYARVYTASSRTEEFKHGGDISEMLAQISKRQNEAQVLQSRLAGKGDKVIELETVLNDYNATLTVCGTCKEQADAFFAKAAEIVGDDDHLSSGDCSDIAKLIPEVKALYAQWQPAYSKILTLHDDYGVGHPGTFVPRQPDMARYNAVMNLKNPNSLAVVAESAQTQAKALAGLGGAEAPSVFHAKKEKKPSYVQSYDPVKEQEAHDKGIRAQTANGTLPQIAAAKQRVEGLRNQLQCWLSIRQMPGAQEKYEEGKARIAKGQAQEAQVKKDDTYSLENMGNMAISFYKDAVPYFQEGIALYPTPWPTPKDIEAAKGG